MAYGTAFLKSARLDQSYGTSRDCAGQGVSEFAVQGSGEKISRSHRRRGSAETHRLHRPSVGQVDDITVAPVGADPGRSR